MTLEQIDKVKDAFNKSDDFKHYFFGYMVYELMNMGPASSDLMVKVAENMLDKSGDSL